MGMPKDIKIIDCMLGIPEAEDRSEWFASFRPLIKDQQTLDSFKMPAQYMFKDIPETGNVDDFVKWTVDQMDQHNIDKALIGFNEYARAPLRARYSRPSQSLWFQHPKHGITAKWEIFLEDMKAGPAATPVQWGRAA